MQYGSRPWPQPLVRTKPTNGPPRSPEAQAETFVAAAQQQARRQLKRLRDQANGGYDGRRKASAG